MWVVDMKMFKNKIDISLYGWIHVTHKRKDTDTPMASLFTSHLEHFVTLATQL